MSFRCFINKDMAANVDIAPPSECPTVIIRCVSGCNANCAVSIERTEGAIESQLIIWCKRCGLVRIENRKTHPTRNPLCTFVPSDYQKENIRFSKKGGKELANEVHSRRVPKTVPSSLEYPVEYQLLMR